MCRTVMLPPATLSVAMFMTWMGYRWASSLRSSGSVPAVLSGHCPDDDCTAARSQAPKWGSTENSNKEHPAWYSMLTTAGCSRVSRT